MRRKRGQSAFTSTHSVTNAIRGTDSDSGNLELRTTRRAACDVRSMLANVSVKGCQQKIRVRI